jgi:hypothetical protein
VELLIRDNYFENPDLLRDYALSLDSYREHSDLVAWKGKRSLPFKLENTLCLCCNKPVKHTTEIDKLINLESERILSDSINYFNLYEKYPSEEITITSFFHLNEQDSRDYFENFSHDKFHQDYGCYAAGVVYLTPNPDSTSGTSILDGKNERIVRVENKYNRLVCYESFLLHAPSNFFGDCENNARMTFTFFIHPSSLLIHS